MVLFGGLVVWWLDDMVVWWLDDMVAWWLSDKLVPGVSSNGDIFYRSSLFILAGAGAELLSSQPAVSQQEEKTENKSHLGKLRGRKLRKNNIKYRDCYQEEALFCYNPQLTTEDFVNKYFCKPSFHISRLFIDIIESLPYHEILPRTSNTNLVIFLRKSSKIPQDFVALDLIREMILGLPCSSRSPDGE